MAGERRAPPRGAHCVDADRCLLIDGLSGSLADDATSSRRDRSGRHTARLGLGGSATRTAGALEALGRNGTVRVVATGRFALLRAHRDARGLPHRLPRVLQRRRGRVVGGRAAASLAGDGPARRLRARRAVAHPRTRLHGAPRGARYALFPLLPLDVRQHRLRTPHRALRPLLATPGRRGAGEGSR